MVALGAVTGDAHTMQDHKQLRRDLEKELPATEAAFRSAPGHSDSRRAYADLLFRLGNVWEANEVLAPLATVTSANTHDLELGARIALMLCDYNRAEALYKRLLEVGERDSDLLSADPDGDCGGFDPFACLGLAFGARG
jgi:hypothetical protein